MTAVERVELPEIPLLRFCSPQVRQLVAASFEPVSFSFGDVIVRQGEKADAFYVLVSGRARALTAAPDGGEVALAVLRPGDSFGEIGILRETPRTATVRASGPVEALRLDASVLRALVATNPEVREHFDLHLRHLSLSELFRRYPPFARLPEDALAQLLRAVEPVRALRGDRVIREGEPPGPLYVVEEGRLRASRRGRDVAFYRTGDVFGERSLFTCSPRGATVTAVSDCRLLRLPEETFRTLLERQPAFHAGITERVEQYDHERLARVPLDFAEELLPADAAAGERRLDEQEEPGGVHVAEVTEAPAGAVDPFATEDGRFVKRGGRIRRFRHTYQVDEADCGAACLVMLCRHFGRRISLARARRVANTSIDGSSLGGLVRGAQEFGLAARSVKASRRNLDLMPLPAVLHWKGNHWVVLYDVSGDSVRIADPAVGLRRLPRSEVEEHWTGYAALFERTPAFDELEDSPSAGTWLRPLARRYLRPFLVAALLALVLSGLQLLIPVSTQIVVDRVLAPGDSDMLLATVLTLVGALTLAAGGSFLQRYLLARTAVRMDAEALDVVAGKMLSLPLPFFYARRTGDLQRRLVGLRQVREFGVTYGVQALTSLAQLVAVTTLMFVYSRVLTLVFLAAAPAYAVLLRFARTRIRPITDALEESFGEYSSRQIDAVKGIETVKVLGAEEALRQELAREFAALSDRQYRADLASMTYQGAVQVVTLATFAAFLGIGALEVLHGDLTIGAFVSFNLLLALATAAIVFLLNLWDALQLASVLVNRLNDIFEEHPEQGGRTELRPVASLEGRVTLERVGFRYGGPHAPKILDDISLDVRPGTTVAIVGRSGSGKTTLVKCLAGLLEPTEGTIRFDGVDLFQLRYRDLRRHIGFVLQENFLFSDTITRNIAFGEEHPDMERVLWAARVANAHEFIVRLPLGYETRIGESGLLLSGGQRQRIAIARALYHRPPVLVLDEATSALDAESEQAVQENMGQLLEGRTSFVIAHRLSTIRHADVIVVIDRGRLIEQGTHEELMGHKGLYYYLVSRQLEL